MRITACRSVGLYWVSLGCWFLLKEKKPRLVYYLCASLAMSSCVLWQCGISWLRGIRYPKPTGIFLPKHIRKLLWIGKPDHAYRLVLLCRLCWRFVPGQSQVTSIQRVFEPLLHLQSSRGILKCLCRCLLWKKAGTELILTFQRIEFKLVFSVNSF